MATLCILNEFKFNKNKKFLEDKIYSEILQLYIKYNVFSIYFFFVLYIFSVTYNTYTTILFFLNWSVYCQIPFLKNIVSSRYVSVNQSKACHFFYILLFLKHFQSKSVKFSSSFVKKKDHIENQGDKSKKTK